jgi:aldehyde dehydrogenase (NAD+)
MNPERIGDVLERQREFFISGKTRDVSFRIESLRKLLKVILQWEDKIIDALYRDLRKSKFESYGTEIGFLCDAIRHQIRHIRSWSRPRRIKTPLTLFPASSRIYPEPFGSVLIISPWNYPFLLIMEPLAGALSAGNCAVVKPSELAPNTATIIQKMIRQTFEARHVEAIQGGKVISQMLLEQRFDYIFYSGGQDVGRSVMAAASSHLTPVTLELGGKSPCIVLADAHLGNASRRIAWGKWLNAGQTCTAPDYVLVDRSIKEKLLEGLIKRVKQFYGDNPRLSPDYARIINCIRGRVSTGRTLHRSDHNGTYFS